MVSYPHVPPTSLLLSLTKSISAFVTTKAEAFAAPSAPFETADYHNGLHVLKVEELLAEAYRGLGAQ